MLFYVCSTRFQYVSPVWRTYKHAHKYLCHVYHCFGVFHIGFAPDKKNNHNYLNSLLDKANAEKYFMAILCQVVATKTCLRVSAT